MEPMSPPRCGDAEYQFEARLSRITGSGIYELQIAKSGRTTWVRMGSHLKGVLPRAALVRFAITDSATPSPIQKS